jgi:hypothetical protein
MNNSSIVSRSSITRAGTIARECLAPGQRGRVLASFSQAIYLQSEIGELSWITSEDAPMHRRCAQISSPLPRLSTGAGFHVQGQILDIDPCYSFDMGTAFVWQEPHQEWMVEPDDLYSRVQTLFANLDYSLARGFGTFIPLILSLPQDGTSDLLPEPADPILRCARPLVMNMARACLEHKLDEVTKSVEPLIGLGAGLTPSGDDFLGGLFFAMKTLRSYHPDMDFYKSLPAMEPYHSRTHLISFTLLNDLADSHAVAPLHEILNGLLCGKPPEFIFPFVSQLTFVGQSTGWDLLTGLLAGLLSTVKSHYFISSLQLTKSMDV